LGAHCGEGRDAPFPVDRPWKIQPASLQAPLSSFNVPPDQVFSYERAED
jgi:hypothetical protein